MWEHGISERLFSEGMVLDTGGLFSGGMVLGKFASVRDVSCNEGRALGPRHFNMCFHMGLRMPGVKLIIAAGRRIETECEEGNFGHGLQFQPVGNCRQGKPSGTGTARSETVQTSKEAK